jgi:uncharacterized SAM-binding protein YcdF (DUF218 family)
VVTSLLVLLTLSSGWTATILLLPLEHAHGPARLRGGDQSGARAIVVLGAYGITASDLPVSSWTNDAGLFRIVEAVHLFGHCRECQIVLSGSTPTVDAMARVLESLDTPVKQIEVDGHSDTTAASARSLADRLHGAPFYLVTSAGHMPRAVLAFRAQGLHPLPAPTDYRAPRDLLSANPLPTPKSLRLSDLALHEYFGIIWYRMQGM